MLPVDFEAEAKQYDYYQKGKNITFRYNGEQLKTSKIWCYQGFRVTCLPLIWTEAIFTVHLNINENSLVWGLKILELFPG